LWSIAPASCRSFALPMALRPVSAPLLTPSLASISAGFRGLHLGVTTLAKKKQRVVAIRLVSAAGTGFAYTTKRKATLGKLQLRKYDPVLRKHVWFTEEKISRKRIVQRRR